jgi:hypothetical protein
MSRALFPQQLEGKLRDSGEGYNTLKNLKNIHVDKRFQTVFIVACAKMNKSGSTERCLREYYEGVLISP